MYQYLNHNCICCNALICVFCRLRILAMQMRTWLSSITEFPKLAALPLQGLHMIFARKTISMFCMSTPPKMHMLCHYQIRYVNVCQVERESDCFCACWRHGDCARSWTSTVWCNLTRASVHLQFLLYIS